MPASLLFVCYANMCRSPMAASLAASMFARAGISDAMVPVVSAGTHARPGTPMHSFAAATLAERRTALHEQLGSRVLTAPILTEAGLILTASRLERAACGILAPAAIRRTFTLRQFARLAVAALETQKLPVDAIVAGSGATSSRATNSGATSSDPTGSGATATATADADRLVVAVAAATRMRGRLQPLDASLDDLIDPIGEPMDAFRTCAAMIEAALVPVTAFIAECG